MSGAMSSQPRILVISPAFNEESSICKVASDIHAHCPQADVLVINDKSTDRTERVLQGCGIAHISLPVNLGIGGAVQTGLLYAERNDYDLAVQVDGDGQHPAELIADLLQPLRDGTGDFVIGSRYLGKKQNVSSVYRLMGGYVLSKLIYVLTHKEVKDPTSGFRAYNKRTIAFLAKNYPQDFPEPISTFELIDRGFRCAEVPVTMLMREHGQSSIQGLSTFFYMIKVMFTILIMKIRKRS
jgi:glycosyltransferase involved in cell wall biosynthesis